MISVYTRHHPDCKNAGDKNWRRCNCPKWIWGSVNGDFIRRSARTHNWDEAEEVRLRLMQAVTVPAVPSPQATEPSPPVTPLALPPPAVQTHPADEVPPPAPRRPRVTVRKAVEAYLDLLAFPTLYFYETGYSLHTLRQASRRSWRIGQRFPVRVKFVTYAGTMQETCLRLMGKKMLVALMMEGKFSGEGLQALDTDEDLMSAMARELVEKAGVGESANAVWRELALEREKVQPRPAAVDPEPEEDSAPILELAVAPAAQPVPLTFGMQLMKPSPKDKKRRKTAVWPTATEQKAQFSLFD